MTCTSDRSARHRAACAAWRSRRRDQQQGGQLRSRNGLRADQVISRSIMAPLSHICRAADHTIAERAAATGCGPPSYLGLGSQPTSLALLRGTQVRTPDRHDAALPGGLAFFCSQLRIERTSVWPSPPPKARQPTSRNILVGTFHGRARTAYQAPRRTGLVQCSRLTAAAASFGGLHLVERCRTRCG